MTENRKERLEEAWSLSLQGNYDAALDALKVLLAEDGADVKALRLNGNVLELKALDMLEHSGKRLTTSADYMAARRSYEKILEIDAENTKALIDLGDHYGNLKAYDRAITYYERAQEALRKISDDSVWREEVEELRQAASLLIKHDRVASNARAIEAWCKQAIE
jgi:tetratricopeptide (TPR) repeat protein